MHSVRSELFTVSESQDVVVFMFVFGGAVNSQPALPKPHSEYGPASPSAPWQGATNRCIVIRGDRVMDSGSIDVRGHVLYAIVGGNKII